MNEERLKFAARLTELAAQLGYKGHGKQTRLAEYYSKSQPSVKKWFDGEAQPEYEVSVDICKRARVHFEWLMTGRGPKSMDSAEAETQRPPALSLVYVAPDELRILTAYREATPMGKAVIASAADGAPRAESLDLVVTTRHKP